MPDLRIVFLQPVAEELHENLTDIIKKYTGFSTYLQFSNSNLNAYLDKDREQYNAVKIIESFSETDTDKLLLITDVDLFIPIFTFVFGLAKLNGKVGIVSTHRLNNIYYGLPEDNEILVKRIQKEIVHEFGHLVGLKHCERYDCVMASSTDVEELDTKSANYCASCLTVVQTSLC